MRSLIESVGLLALIAALATPALAADYYVREDGNDSCDGRSDSGGSSGSCALRSIGAAIAKADCGDTINVRAGHFYDDAVTIREQCTAGSPLVITGAGPNTTVWHPQGAPVSCSLDSGNVYRCPIPPSGKTTAEDSDAPCFAQKVSNEFLVQDENGVGGMVKDWFCMTTHSSASSVSSTPGSWTVDGDDYLVHLWNSASPSSDMIVAPSDSVGRRNYGIFPNDTSAYVTISDLTIVAGADTALVDQGKNNTFEDLHVYGGTYKSEFLSVGHTGRRLKVAQTLRRPMGGSGTSGKAFDRNNQTFSIKGTDITFEDIEIYAGREGFGMSAVSGLRANRFVSRWHSNHGFKFTSDAHDIVIDNLFVYNTQEGAFITECAYDITIRNSTIAMDLLIHDNFQGTTCPTGFMGPSNIDIYNTMIHGVIWLSNFGDARSGARDHDWDYNVYFSDSFATGGRPNGAFQHHPPSGNSFSSLSAWQNWSADTCTNCTRDPNSIVSSVDTEFVDYNWREGRGPYSDTPGHDFDLRAGAKAIDKGDANRAPDDNTDIDGFTRSGRPDIGAYEREDVTSTPECSDGVDNDGDGQVDAADSGCSSPSDEMEANCGDGVINASEVCDGGDLGGETCESQGFASGTLACTSTCDGYDTSSCVSSAPPADVENLRRSDVK